MAPVWVHEFCLDIRMQCQDPPSRNTSSVRPSKDVNALAKLAKQIGDLAVGARDPTIAELDLNPVLVHPEGVSVVDILARTGT